MRLPLFRRNPDGRGFSQWKKRRYYFGPFDSPEAKRKYAAFIKRISDDAEEPLPLPGKPTLVGELCDAYLRFARTYYASNGKVTKEFVNVQHAIKPFAEVCSMVEISKFGPVLLSEYQQYLVDLKDEETKERVYARGVINSRIGRIKRMFKWCTQRELISPTVFHGLQTVPGLRAGRTDARETEPVEPVPIEHVKSLLPYVNRQVGAMMLTQYYAGMRSSEVIRMRPCDIDRSNAVWLYRPETHKTAHLGAVLIKAIPKVAQVLIEPFMERDPEAYLFSPREAQAERRAVAKNRRKMKRSRKNLRYSTDTYRQAIIHGIKKAKNDGVDIPYFFPHRIRHATATEIAVTLGASAAQSWLGHSQLDSTQVYIQKQERELLEVAKQLDKRWAKKTPRKSKPVRRTKRRQPKRTPQPRRGK